MVGLEFGEFGGHWGGYVYDVLNNKLNIFESMQSMQGENVSAYTKTFAEYGKRFFGVKKILIQGPDVSPRIRGNKPRQPTGGFLGFFTPSKKKYNKEELLLIQELNSQHHFCYMEALLFIIEFLMFIENERHLTPLRKFNETEYKSNVTTHPLYVIKRFLFALVKYLDMLDYREQKNYTKFIKNHSDWCSIDDANWINPETTKKQINFYFKYFKYVWDPYTKSLNKIIRSEDLTRKFLSFQDIVKFAYSL